MAAAVQGSGGGSDGLLGQRSGGRRAAVRCGLGDVLLVFLRFLELRLWADGVALAAVNSGDKLRGPCGSAGEGKRG
jgi:hypothetical protein